MEELILKYIEKDCDISDNEIRVPTENLSEYNNKLYDVFGIKVDLHEILSKRYKEGYCIIYNNGDKEWFKKGKRHREGDKPAIIYSNGDKEWYKNGDYHREGDKPAIIYSTGYKAWYENGEYHREGDKPAIIYSTGEKEWWVNDKLIKSGV